MTPSVWVTWDAFLVGQVGLIHKLNYLNVAQIFNRSHVLWKKTFHREPWASWMDWTITGMKPAYYLKLFWSMWCPEISFPRILFMGLVLYPEEIYGIASYLIFSMSFYITFKENFSLWVTRGSYVGNIGIALWVSRSSGSTGVTHFQPWYLSNQLAI